MASIAERAAEQARAAIKKDAAQAQDKGTQAKKEARNMDKATTTPQGWVYSQEAMELLGIVSSGALGKYRTQEKIHAVKDDAGRWIHSVDSIMEYNRTKGKATNLNAGTRRGKTTQGNKATTKDKATSPKATNPDARIARLEQEVAALREQLIARKRSRLLAPVRKIGRAAKAAISA